MVEKIKENIRNPEELEKLYRSDRKAFKQAFGLIYPGIEDSQLTQFWKIRLDDGQSAEQVMKYTKADIFVMVVICLLSALLIKIPAIVNLTMSDLQFYSKNAAMIVFTGLTLYALWFNRIDEKKRLLTTLALFLVPLLYINLLPCSSDSQSVTLAYIHLPLLMWAVYSIVYMEFDYKDKARRLEYIRYNGDLAVMSAIILIAGGILTGITISLFSVININIEIFYRDYIILTGLVSVPVVATFVIKNNSGFTNKIAPVIADIFSPVVLLTLVIYLAVIAVSGKDPYNDRDFLFIFNIMLLGVMAIIVFSVSEASAKSRQRFNEIILFILSIVTLIIDLIALSAIFYRLGEYGVSPNRLAVLGSNILIFGNLVLIMIDLYKVNLGKTSISKVGMTIAGYLPVYLAWVMIVVFVFPLIFGMK